MEEPAAGQFPETPEWSFVFVNHVTTNPFFVPTVYGIEDASAILGTTYQWTGSEIADNGEMVNALEAAIAADADGIGIALVDLEAFNGPTDEALAAGIPVIWLQRRRSQQPALPTSVRTSTGPGSRWGSASSSWWARARSPCSSPHPGQLNIQPRIDGAMAAITESGADIQAEAIATGAALEEELSTVEAWYLGNRMPPGCSPSTPGAPRRWGRWCRVPERSRQGTRRRRADTTCCRRPSNWSPTGSLDFTIDQQPYLQGFLPVVYLYLWKLSGGVVTPPETNTGLVFLDSASAQLFLDTESRFEGDAEEQKHRRAGC